MFSLFRVTVSGFGVSMFRVSSSRFRVQCSGFSVFRIRGSGFSLFRVLAVLVSSFGLEVRGFRGSGFKVTD